MYSRMNAIIKRIVKSTKPKNCDKIYFMNGIAIPKDKSSVPDFNYKILINRNITAPALGRWRVDKEKVEEEKTVDWANHDHCGSDSCRLEDAKFDEHEEKNDKDDKDDKDVDAKLKYDNYEKNYMTAFII
jgi:hypothetical protein